MALWLVYHQLCVRNLKLAGKVFNIGLIFKYEKGNLSNDVTYRIWYLM
jgi:hypothetical protein